jgi:hypothetical protein
MRRSLVALVSLVFALACWSQPRLFVHRVAMNFAPGSSQMPAEGAAVLESMVSDATRECSQPAYANIVVEEVRLLPLGKTTSGPTPRTQQVAAALRRASQTSLAPYEGSLSPDGDRARQLGLKVDQVLVELTCPPRGV